MFLTASSSEYGIGVYPINCSVSAVAVSAEQGGQQQGLSQETIVSTVCCIADAAMLHAATQCPVAGSVFANTAPGAGVIITLPRAGLTP